jgi:hypothetical protein
MGRGRFTLHIDAGGRCLGMFRNAGDWTNREYDILNECERM